MTLDDLGNEAASAHPTPVAGPDGPAHTAMVVSPAADQVAAGRVDEAVDPVPPVDSTGPQQPREAGRHLKLLYVTLPGCWGALIFACLSFIPSLLPRGGVVQGLVVGINAAIGYGLGVMAAWIWRAFADRDARPARSWAWPTLIIGGLVLVSEAPRTRLSDIVCSVGPMCQRPNSADVIRVARHGPHNLSADPSRTSRNANSSGIAVTSRIGTVS